MVRKCIIGACATLAIVLAMPSGAAAQTTDQNLQDILDQLGITDLSDLGNIQDILDQVTGGTDDTDQPTATQPSGSPANFIQAGIARHKAFYTNAALTPEQRRENLPDPDVEFRLPIVYAFPALANLLADLIPGLDWLADFFGGIVLPPVDDDDDDVEPPPGADDVGPVVFLTADDTTLAIGEETTVRLWVQQSSPNSTNDNGIFSVAVNVEARPAAIVESEPVTILPDWDDALPSAQRGTPTASGGIQGIVAGPGVGAPRNLGIGDPVQVASFTATASAAGTVTLTPTNFIGDGFEGLLDYDREMGDEDEYVSVEITVTE